MYKTVVYLFCLVFLCMCTGNKNYEIEISSGDVDRHTSIVSFTIPDDLNIGDNYLMVSADNDTIALQIDVSGNAWCIIPTMRAGETFTYRIISTEQHQEGASLRERDGKFDFIISQRPVLTYNFDETKLPRADIDPIFTRGGYIHPVQTPKGIVITDDYPSNHIHHHGIWAAWTKTVFEGRQPDFWNMGQGKGTVVPDKMIDKRQGPVFAGIVAQHKYIDLTTPEPTTAINEQWTIRAYHLPESNYYLFDQEVFHECATSSPLMLPEYHYGGVGFRGHGDWDGAENTIFLTSEGKDRSNGHATAANWCHIGGYVNGSLAGITIMVHPDNFRAPQSMRIHPTEPFFNFAPSQGGDWAITPDDPFYGKYRYVVYDGEPNVELLESIWNDYAHPMKVVLK